jgi:NarL family two-component system response regulator LiaR
MTEEKPIRILLVDDHALVRSGLRNFIYAYDWMSVVGEAADGAEAVTFCINHPVDMVLMDMVMPEMDGAEATRQIIALGKPIKVIILTSYYEQEMVEQSLQAGAISYLLKNVSAAELSQAIRAAFAGRSTLAPEATEALINAARRKPGLGSDLTERELQVLSRLVLGMSNSEIATHFNISLSTVKYHLSNILSKLGAKSRVEAVTIALKHNLVEKE